MQQQTLLLEKLALMSLCCLRSAIIFFIAFVLDAAFSLSLCGFLIMHGRMVAQVCHVLICAAVHHLCMHQRAKQSTLSRDSSVSKLLAVQNRTTIEMYEKVYVEPWPYHRGWRRNFEEV